LKHHHRNILLVFMLMDNNKSPTEIKKKKRNTKDLILGTAAAYLARTMCKSGFILFLAG